ncbi:MAG: TlpA disulfide reductase family protein [Candidatus Fermentibacteraceae bacterium]
MGRRFPWWIPALLVLLVPAFRAATRLSRTAFGEQGVLLTGTGSLDSLMGTAGTRPVLLNFWATWCSPCVHELPVLDSLYIEYDGEVLFAAVSIGDPDLSTLVSFRESVSIAMPVVWLSPSEADVVRERYDIPSVLPVTIVIVDGRETARLVGAATAASFREAIGGRTEDTETAQTDETLHFYVVGSPSDSVTIALHRAAVALAGEGNVDLVDPFTPEGAGIIYENMLPTLDRPYAQACRGLACYTPMFSPEQVLATFGPL